MFTDEENEEVTDKIETLENVTIYMIQDLQDTNVGYY